MLGLRITTQIVSFQPDIESHPHEYDLGCAVLLCLVKDGCSATATVPSMVVFVHFLCL